MVNVIYANALAEVEQILKNTEEELVAKIPSSMRKFINENKNAEYKMQIDNTKSLEEQKILAETQAILALIYRNYWATEEEKQEFERQDAIELEAKNKAKENLYSADVFKGEKEITDIVVVREEKWYQKAWRKICILFGCDYKI